MHSCWRLYTAVPTYFVQACFICVTMRKPVQSNYVLQFCKKLLKKKAEDHQQYFMGKRVAAVY